MNTGKTLFSQLMDFLPWTTFTRVVERYGGDHRVRPRKLARDTGLIAASRQPRPRRNSCRRPRSRCARRSKLCAARNHALPWRSN